MPKSRCNGLGGGAVPSIHQRYHAIGNMMKKRRVRFVFRKSQMKWGSTTMRAHQLIRLIRPFIGDNFELELVPLPNRRIPGIQLAWAAVQPRDCFYFFTKFAADSINSDALSVLHARSRGVCFDYVDAPLDRMVMDNVDVHIACSFSSFNSMNEIIAGRGGSCGRVRLLLHGADERVYSINKTNRDNLSIMYFGSMKNAIWSDKIGYRVDFIDASDSQSAEENFHNLEKYSMHYCVRPIFGGGVWRSFKPFTKGVIAAHCGSPVIVNKGVDDVDYFLPNDYPYLVDGNDESSVIDVIEKARSTFGSADWLMALDVMRNIVDMTTPKAMAEQFSNIFNEF